MIFQHTLEQTLAGDKTQTRRVIHEGDTAIRARYNRIAAVVTNGRTKWHVGKTYAVQPGRGKPSVARIKILQINSEYVTRISTQAAQAEGFSSRGEFLDTWKRIHGEASLGCRVWVLRFELVSERMITYPQEKLLVYVAG